MSRPGTAATSWWMRPRGRPAKLAVALIGVLALGAVGSATADPQVPAIPLAGTGTLSGPGTGAQAAARQAAAAEPTTVETHLVTLPTGDRFQVEVGQDGRQQVSVAPADAQRADTAGGTFVHFESRGDTYVIPAEAAPYLGTTLDPQLFNVGHLIRAGLADARADSLPVTVTAAATAAKGLPATKVTAATADKSTAAISKKDAGGLGELLAKRWRETGSDGAGVGTLPGVERIALATPAGAPKAPADPTEAITATANKGGGKGTRYHTLTVEAIDRAGDPGVMVGFVNNVDDGRRFTSGFTSPGEGKKSFVVPEGNYSVSTAVFSEPGYSFSTVGTLAVEPQVRVTGDVTVTLDARKAVPYRATVESDPNSAMPRADNLYFVRTSTAGDESGVRPSGFGPIAGLLMGLSSYSVHGNATLYAVPTRSVTAGSFNFAAHTSLSELAEEPIGKGSTYKMLFLGSGTVPESLTYSVKNSDLTTVRSTLHTSASDGAPAGPSKITHRAYFPWSWSEAHFASAPAAGNRTDYVYSNRPDEVYWQNIVIPDGGPTLDILEGARRKVRPGQEITEVWNRGPDVPSPMATYTQVALYGIWGTADPDVPDPMQQVCAACRQGELGFVYPRPAGDSDPQHFHDAPPLDASVEFHRNGQLVFTTAVQPYLLPAMGHPLMLPMRGDAAEYQLNWSVSDPNTTGASNHTQWTFRSAGDGDAPFPSSEDLQCVDPATGCSFLPLLYVNYDLPVDVQNRAPAGEAFDIGFRVSHQQHQAAPTGVTGTVEVSYDDGATWSAPQNATANTDGTFTTRITHPAYTDANRWVSLRVTARDADGSAVTQTNIRAYRLAS
jgi:hypothetical protein